MRYMLMLNGEEPNWEEVDPAETQEMIDAMGRYNQEMVDAGVMEAGGGLRERATATTVHFKTGGDPLVTDGPFAESKEQFMGYWIIDCADFDEALAWTLKAPLGEGTAIEIRPLAEESPDENDISGEELIKRAQTKA